MGQREGEGGREEKEWAVCVTQRRKRREIEITKKEYQTYHNL